MLWRWRRGGPWRWPRASVRCSVQRTSSARPPGVLSREAVLAAGATQPRRRTSRRRAPRRRRPTSDQSAAGLLGLAAAGDLFADEPASRAHRRLERSLRIPRASQRRSPPHPTRYCARPSTTRDATIQLDGRLLRLGPWGRILWWARARAAYCAFASSTTAPRVAEQLARRTTTARCGRPASVLLALRVRVCSSASPPPRRRGSTAAGRHRRSRRGGPDTSTHFDGAARLARAARRPPTCCAVRPSHRSQRLGVLRRGRCMSRRQRQHRIHPGVDRRRCRRRRRHQRRRLHQRRHRRHNVAATLRRRHPDRRRRRRRHRRRSRLRHHRLRRRRPPPPPPSPPPSPPKPPPPPFPPPSPPKPPPPPSPKPSPILAAASAPPGDPPGLRDARASSGRRPKTGQLGGQTAPACEPMPAAACNSSPSDQRRKSAVVFRRKVRKVER